MRQYVFEWSKYSDVQEENDEFTQEEHDKWTINEFMKSLIEQGETIVSAGITQYDDKGIALKGFVVTVNKDDSE